MKRKIFVICLWLFSVSLLSAQSQSFSGPVLEIGSVLPLTGPMGSFGQQWRRGMEVYLKYYHAEKKTGGKEIRILFSDDAFKPEKTYQAVKDLVEAKKVFALVGSLGSPASQSVLDYIFSSGTPWVGPGSGSALLYNPPRKMIFPVQPSFYIEGRVMARFASENLKKGRITVIYQNDELGRSSLDGVKSLLSEKGRRYGLLLDSVPVEMKERDFSAVAQRVAQSSPETVVVFAFGKTVADLLRALKRAGIHGENTAILTTYINADPFVFQLGEAGLWDGVYSAAWIPPYSKDWLKLWKKYGGSDTPPSVYEASGWAAMETFTEGLIRMLTRFQGEPDWKNFQSAMESFKEDQGWTQGLVHGLSYSRYYSRNPFCRAPQQSLYFLKGKQGHYEKAPELSLEGEFFISAY